MITESMIYWITRLDSIINFLIGFEIMSVIIFFICLVCKCLLNIELKYPNLDGYEEAKVLMPIVLRCIWVTPVIFFISSFLLVFTPTTKEMAMIYILPKVNNSEFIEKTGGRLNHLSDMAFDKLEEVLGISAELEE